MSDGMAWDRGPNGWEARGILVYVHSLTDRLTSSTFHFVMQIFTQLLRRCLEGSSGREALMMLQGALASPPPSSFTPPAPQEDDEVEWKQGGGGKGVHPSVIPWLVGRTTEGACICLCVSLNSERGT